MKASLILLIYSTHLIEVLFSTAHNLKFKKIQAITAQEVLYSPLTGQMFASPAEVSIFIGLKHSRW